MRDRAGRPAAGYRDDGKLTKRLRGSQGVKQRRRRLEAERYLCRDCKAKGIFAEAKVIDHIIPLAKGGSDEDSNTRPLCHPCHDRRTAEQFGMGKITRKPVIGPDGWPLS